MTQSEAFILGIVGFIVSMIAFGVFEIIKDFTKSKFLKCCDNQKYSKWSEPEKLSTRDSFSSSSRLIQSRSCDNCGFSDSRTIKEVTSGR